jgi:hypothetical protein
MYPAGELNALVRRKADLRRRIAQQRWACAEAGARIMQPVVWIDGLRARWRGVAPLVMLALVPLVAVLRRRILRRVRGAGALLRWAPIAFAAVRAVQGLRDQGARRRSAR